MNLKTYLEQFDVKPAEIAAATGVTVQAISQYCLGKRCPRHQIARKIVKATRGKVRLDDLYPAEAEGERA